jgi:hypothetical protein
MRDDPADFPTEKLKEKATAWATGITAGMMHIVQTGFVHRE